MREPKNQMLGTMVPPYAVKCFFFYPEQNKAKQNKTKQNEAKQSKTKENKNKQNKNKSKTEQKLTFANLCR